MIWDWVLVHLIDRMKAKDSASDLCGQAFSVHGVGRVTTFLYGGRSRCSKISPGTSRQFRVERPIYHPANGAIKTSEKKKLSCGDPSYSDSGIRPCGRMCPGLLFSRTLVGGMGRGRGGGTARVDTAHPTNVTCVYSTPVFFVNGIGIYH